jgi:mycothiol S-conjugate amidase
VHTVLVTATGGEEGDILNPTMDRPEIRSDLPAVRQRELETAARVIGYDETVMLGYRDSGMPGSESNANPLCFGAAPLDEAIGRLVAVIRRTRPQVIVCYGEDHSRYPHPDHIRVHDISVGAFEAAGDPSRYREAGEPYQPLKLYYVVWSRRRVRETHKRLLELGLESPFDEEWLEFGEEDDEVTTSVDIKGFEDVRREALVAHATQIDPTSKHWFSLPADEARKIYPYDDYVLARSLVETETPETDLFAGIWASVSA